jgi:GT2 family glycosyltransferase/glycosyltransferase involved in cell wall biosynthesis
MKICLVTMELLGAHKNGGIGTATSYLSLLLAKHGHEVTVVHLGPPLPEEDDWTQRYRDNSVTIISLQQNTMVVMPDWVRPSVFVYEYLKTRLHELIIFPDWLGLGYASILAKQAGLSFQRTALVVMAHGPSEWLVEANRTLVKDASTLATIFMERQSIEGADQVIGPSQFLLDWMDNRGWALPRPRAMPLHLGADDKDAPASTGTAIGSFDSISFFGRLEERKGVRLFTQALLTAELPDRLQIHYLGREATCSASEIRSIIEQYRPALQNRIHFHTNYDAREAQNFLIENNSLAVIPSLTDNSPCVVSECIQRNIPFLATAVGGIPELIHPEDWDAVLCKAHPRALAAKLSSTVKHGLPRLTRPSISPSAIATEWLAWVDGVVHAFTSMAVPPAIHYNRQAANPECSVVIAHYERPGLLLQTLSSLAVQTFKAFEVVVVDDGSVGAASIDLLADLEQSTLPFPLRVVRQQNRYLGAARNNGVRHAQSDRIIIMDDDNVAFPTMIETFLRAEASTGADIITCQMQVFTDASRYPDPSQLRSGERWAFTGGPAELGVSFNCFGDANAIYQRSAFDRIGGFFEEHGVGHEDWQFFARASLAGLKIISLPVPLYWYRRTPSGMLLSTDPYRNMKVVWDVYRAHLGPRGAFFADLAARHPVYS